ncbi:juvenile hormone esterase-like [Diprion similis]|uniref:juvenile hormone esterase-like n=1 Tax=Diprion similis TaxID=362088 RepID=UPI001EF895E8|nr:juvenile hormone esterase-like [Diprion similis]
MRLVYQTNYSEMVRPVVLVKEGSLCGTETKTKDGFPFISFKGIPYAEPPVGELRFKDPQPKQPWTGVLDALEESPQCPQLDEFTHDIRGEEDCLYINVATTSLKGSRPVMVWIHGGGFLWGNAGSSIYGPDYLIKKDIVYVSMNYRLGIFGFLQLDHEAATGNMGLKDQVVGLKWVKENVAQFGGDPNNVTIFGESAGGACIHYLLLSPLTKGLFHKAISQSGVALNPWARAFKTAEIAQRVAAHFGKETTDPNEIVKFLRTIPAHKLADSQFKILTPEEKIVFGFAFAPTVDDKSSEPFLPRPAIELAAEAHDVPLLIGYNSHEGVVHLLGPTADDFSKLDQHFEASLSRGLTMVPPSKVLDAAKQVRKFYLGDRPVTKETSDEFVQAMGDLQFVVGVHDVVSFRTAAKSPTYLYRFSHEAEVTFGSHLTKVKVKGAAHADELVYLFHLHRIDLNFLKPGSIEEVISERFLRMWTDFAKTGDPTPQQDDLITVKWKPITSTTKNYLSIRAELSTGVNPDEEMLQLWNRVRSIGKE